MPFPPYAYVPGHWPHPTRDPQGHSYGRPEIVAQPLSDNPDTWPHNEVFVHALDLFDHGYYWEAHEGLEALWIAAGRQGPIADLLSALIKLAAAAIKVRQGKPDSAAKLTMQAGERLDDVRPGLCADAAARLTRAWEDFELRHDCAQPDSMRVVVVHAGSLAALVR